jgi:hypothetical protein
MRNKSGPKGNAFTAVQNDTAIPQTSFGASLDEQDSGEPVLASGWWIVPCALGGLIECYVIVQWLIAKL